MLFEISAPPRFTAEEIVSFVSDQYNIKAKIKLLVSDIGQNFYVSDVPGKEYILKIANPSESESILEAQNLTLEHLKNNKFQFRLPQVIQNVNGQKITQIIGENGIPYHTRLLSYLPGKFLADLSVHSDVQLKDLGRLLGSMDKLLQNFDHPAVHRFWHWDLMNISYIRPLTKYIKDPAGRRLVDYLILQFESEVLSHSNQLRRSLIHNDANDHNILVNAAKVDGIIDFGDMVHSLLIFELAIAAAYIMLNKKDPLNSASLVVEAYHQVLPLQKNEVDVLFYSICARLCQTVTMAAYQQSMRPDNEYLSVSEQPAWILLNQIIQINPEKARHTFYQACSLTEDPVSLLSIESLLESRKSSIGKPLSISYKKPLKIIRGALQYLYDQSGETYLDCVNNVCHVGHAHPTVVRSAQHQIGVLNTNTRYLHDYLVHYAQRLTKKLPDALQVCFFVNSGSEANELALRLAYTHTGQKEVIVIDHAYHGNTPSLIDISPYKYNRKGGQGPGPHTHKTIIPDVYRGSYKSDDPSAGEKYAEDVLDILEKLHDQKKGLAAFIGESLLGCGGQIVLPAGYLKNVYQYIRKNGGVCIADEVQVGFGRVGTHFWGFELQDVVPDIVTLGKPIGNGHPMAAVICTREIADSFVTGMEYFNTFGGNPVSCATGLAVMDVIESENLQKNALKIGRKMMDGFEQLKKHHSIIGDVRGAGLFIGIELVTNSESLDPATTEAGTIVEAMKDRGILLSTDGPYDNVIKLKPPIVFDEDNANRVVETLDDVLKSINL